MMRIRDGFVVLAEKAHVPGGLSGVDELVEEARPALRKTNFQALVDAFRIHYQEYVDFGRAEGIDESRLIFGRSKGLGKKAVDEKLAEGVGELNFEQVADAWSRKQAEDVFGRWLSYLEDVAISTSGTGRMSRLRDLKWEDSTFATYGKSGANQVAEVARQSIIESMGRSLGLVGNKAELAAKTTTRRLMAYYTAIMDENLCVACEATENALLGGVEVGSQTYHDNRPPNPQCHGGGGRLCRCIYVYDVEEVEVEVEVVEKPVKFVEREIEQPRTTSKRPWNLFQTDENTFQWRRNPNARVKKASVPTWDAFTDTIKKNAKSGSKSWFMIARDDGDLVEIRLISSKESMPLGFKMIKGAEAKTGKTVFPYTSEWDSLDKPNGT